MKKFKWLFILLAMMLCMTAFAACGTPDTPSDEGNTPPVIETPDTPENPDDPNEPVDPDTPVYEVEAPGEGPASASDITSVGGAPLVTLNNGVQMPRFGLGTQIQELESGDLGILNQTARESVTAAASR